jgi:hypothetical protein
MHHQSNARMRRRRPHKLVAVPSNEARFACNHTHLLKRDDVDVMITGELAYIRPAQGKALAHVESSYAKTII